MGGVSKFKCENCRMQKRKCEPEDRHWDEEGGVQQRCQKCETIGLPCGPGIKCPTKMRRMSSTRRRNLSGQYSENHELSEHTETNGRHGNDAEQRLKDKLKTLDNFAELYRQFARALDHQDHQDLSALSGKTEIERCQLLARENLLMTLIEIKVLASSLAVNGDSAIAELTYTRALQIMASPPFSEMPVHGDLLLDVAKFYMDNDEPLRAATHLHELLSLDILSQDQEIKVLQNLAKCMQSSSEHVTREFLTSGMAKGKRAVQSPFPPLHRFIAAIPQSTSGLSTVLALNFQDYAAVDITGLPPIHSALTSKDVHVFEMIQSCSHSDLLHIRDICSRTALFLAAQYGLEDAGSRIMDRFAGCPARDVNTLMNARDAHGHTILAIAIISNCSREFIQALIAGGSNPDPDQSLTEQTPLSIAISRDRRDIVELLKGHGATVDESQLGTENFHKPTG